MPQDDVQPHEELVRSSSSMLSLDIVQSNESVSSRSSRISSEQSFRQYIDLPQLEPLELTSREPFLDEVLRTAAGSNDLRTMTEIKIQVSYNMVCIQDLNVFLPNLVSLNLEGSSLSSLRDIGIHLKVKHLNVSRCGLKSLDGTTSLSTVVDLVADDNTIKDVGQLCNLPDLHRLSLKNNCIPNVETVSFLGLCLNLSHLDITGNPVCSLVDYRAAIKSFIPSLKILDEHTFVEEAAEPVASFSSSEYQSSPTTSLSDAKPCSSMEFAELTGKCTSNKLRLGSATNTSKANTLDESAEGWAPRAQSAGPSDNTPLELTRGTPISGNIVIAARRKKRRAWGSSSSSTSCSEMGSFSSHSNSLFGSVHDLTDAPESTHKSHDFE